MRVCSSVRVVVCSSSVCSSSVCVCVCSSSVCV